VTEVPNPYAVDADTLTGEMRPVRRGVLSLGSNLGDRMANLEGALATISDTPDLWVTAVSPVYETTPIDAPEESENFYNIIVLIDTTLSVHRLLERLLLVEDSLGRFRTGVANGPRTLDIDIVVVGDRVANEPDLTLPHPRAHQRAFVLAPWHDLEPNAVIPGVGPIADLLAGLDTSVVVRRDDLVLDF